MGHTVLTQERANILTEYLNADEKRAKELLSLSPEEALPKVNGGIGFSFSLAELKEYGKALYATARLGDDALKGVAGGAGTNVEEDSLVVAGAVVGICAGVVTIVNGVDTFGQNRGWW